MTTRRYRVYRYHQPTDLVFGTYGEAYHAAVNAAGSGAFLVDAMATINPPYKVAP